MRSGRRIGIDDCSKYWVGIAVNIEQGRCDVGFAASMCTLEPRKLRMQLRTTAAHDDEVRNLERSLGEDDLDTPRFKRRKKDKRFQGQCVITRFVRTRMGGVRD